MKINNFLLTTLLLLAAETVCMQKSLSRSGELRQATTELRRSGSQSPALPPNVTRLSNALFQDAEIKIEQSGSSTQINLISNGTYDLEHANYTSPVTITVSHTTENNRTHDTKRENVNLPHTTKLIITLMHNHVAVATPKEWDSYIKEKYSAKAHK